MIVRLATAWVRSLRPHIAGSALPPSGILVLWHADMLPCLRAFSGHGLRVLISRSKDGDLGARAASSLGYQVIRGSSSRGGAETLLSMARMLRNDGGFVALVADGPRGPREVCKPGALWLSEYTQLPVIGVIVPDSSRSKSRMLLRGHWLGFTLGGWARVKLPLPFSRVTVRVSDPFFPRTLEDIEGVMTALKAPPDQSGR